MQSSPAPSLVDARAPDLPSEALSLLHQGEARVGLLYGDGRIAALGSTLLDDLGFHPGDDLRGLSFASFWHHSDRPMVNAALDTAQRDGNASMTLGLGYIKGREGTCTVSLSRAPLPDLMILRLVCNPAPAAA
ncbi:hypothetical protein MWU52_08070 [Jannaschia sp. S6380]|uniref:PAS domain-containing protein n=1 Tax=Jannaschia sp. S6380 TaxID=2926408 RepID=UPI001FF45ACB|nr:PAS domain-containing protein [Jannaschia sp. S6380]MCK0167498.1 hypothetical protein [Jannaschia sp. S6380]